MYTETNDTLFVISFRPQKGKNFDGLKGILHINSNQYAIQNVIAEAAEEKGLFNHQNITIETVDKGYYESGLLVNNVLKQWFIGYGLGLFYRYEPYQLTKTIDNFAFKFTVSINL